MLLFMQNTKITISRSFNMTSKSKMATIVGDVTGVKQRHHP